MKIYRFYIIVLLIFFYSCAVQSPPSGGAINDNPIQVLEVNPKPNTLNINSKSSINLLFNQMVDPKTVKGAFTIYPKVDVLINVIGNKVKILPKKKWPESFFTIISSKSISDYYGNILSEPIVLSYSINDYIPKGEISGEIINFNNTSSYIIGLFNTLNNNFELVSYIEPNDDGKFIFNSIVEDEYVLVAINNNQFKDIYTDIRNFNYCVKIPNKMNAIKKSFNNNLYLYEPAQKLDIKDLNFYNNYFGDIILSDGSIKNFLINNDIYDSKLYNNDIIKINSLNKNDSIDVVLKLENNVENYYVKKVFSNKTNIIDSLNPKIKRLNFKNDSLHIVFTEPVLIDEKIYNYRYISPVEIKFYNNLSTDINFQENSIFDLSGNSMLDTIIVKNNNPANELLDGGNLFGDLIYKGKRDLIIELKNMNENYKTVSINGKFIFNNIQPGIYSLWAYENINKKNDDYFNGKLEPLKSNALFGVYKDEIEVRSKWDIEGIKIKID